MSEKTKTILLVAGILYCIFPDFFPGPIDDFLVLLCTVGAQFLQSKNTDMQF